MADAGTDLVTKSVFEGHCGIGDATRHALIVVASASTLLHIDSPVREKRLGKRLLTEEEAIVELDV